MYLKPAYHKALSLLGRAAASSRDVCQKSWTIFPAETQTVPPAIYRAADLERITAAWNGPSLAYERDCLLAKTREHAATIAYQLKNADLVDGYLYCGRWKDKLLPQRARLLRPGPDQRLAHGTLACTYVGNHFFGHWLLDDLTLYLAADNIGNPFTLERRSYVHENGYRDLLGIPARAVQDTRIDELVILQDFGQNGHKRQRYDTLRARLRKLYPLSGAKRVMLRRGHSGVSRSIVNGEEFEDYLRSVGFVIVDPEHLSPGEIVRQTIDAEIVIGVEGSQLLHALLTMAEGGVLCCVQPPYRFNSTIKGHTDCLEMHFAMLVGHQVPGGFRVEIEELKSVLGEIEAALNKGVMQR